MKHWKTVVLVVVMVMLIAAVVVSLSYALEDENVRATKKRVVTYRILDEEQRLIRSILENKMAIAKMQAAMAPKPAPIPAPTEPVSTP